jgi:hypothetical protein
VEELSLRGAGTLATPLAAFAPLAGLTSLRLLPSRGYPALNLGVSGTKVLVQSPHLANLTLLDLTGHRIGVGGTAAVANSPHLRRLRTLILTNNKIGPKGARALAASPHLDNLILLDLRGHLQPPDAKKALRARFPHAAIHF